MSRDVRRAKSAYAFNELSVCCCDSKLDPERVIQVLAACRAWTIQLAGPLVKMLETSERWKDLLRGRNQSGLQALLDIARTKPTPEVADNDVLLHSKETALGASAACAAGGWCVSWPCACGEWRSVELQLERRVNAEAVSVRHASSKEHLMVHWRSATKKVLRKGRPSSIVGAHDGVNNAAGEIAHVHFECGAALNIDGNWKHQPPRTLSGNERDWLAGSGWILPPVEVR